MGMSPKHPPETVPITRPGYVSGRGHAPLRPHLDPAESVRQANMGLRPMSGMGMGVPMSPMHGVVMSQGIPGMSGMGGAEHSYATLDRPLGHMPLMAGEPMDDAWGGLPAEPTAQNAPQCYQGSDPIEESANWNSGLVPDSRGNLNSDPVSLARYPRMTREIGAGGDRLEAEHHDFFIHKR